MKVQSIQSNNFESKKRFITPKMKEDIKYLLTKMNSEVVESGNENYFKSTFTKSLKYKDEAEFIDGRIFVGRVPNDKQMQRESLVTIGKTQLVIDNSTGEIIDYKKPFFKTWSSVMEQLDHFLTFFRVNYNYANRVTKKRLTMQGFTQKGWEKMCKLMGQA